jgi:methionine-rich copper-binding protein CopC
VKLRVAFVAGFIAALFIGATAVLGHAELESSDPAEGATITTPYTLSATFSEELNAESSSLVVQDSTGKTVGTGAVSATDDKVMTAELPGLPAGGYQVAWTAVTADDNGVTRGVYQFAVAAASATGQVIAPPATSGPAPSGTTGQPTGNANDYLLPLAAVIVIVAAIAGYFIYRNRRPPAA